MSAASAAVGIVRFGTKCVGERRLPEQFVGFYWTLPINWAGFRRLPPGGVEAAAAKSRTIRYQMHAVRRWVAENGGRLVREIVFMELSPDRGTEAVKSELDAVAKLCLPDRATLIYVDFDKTFHWRRHPHLRAYIEEHGISCVPLLPEPVMVSGKLFDPIKHFEESRKKHKVKVESMRETATQELLATAERHLQAEGTYQSISDELNDRGIKTPTGKSWTAEITRKTLKRRGAYLGEET